jgi:hypothetical protein
MPATDTIAAENGKQRILDRRPAGMTTALHGIGRRHDYFALGKTAAGAPWTKHPI